MKDFLNFSATAKKNTKVQAMYTEHIHTQHNT